MKLFKCPKESYIPHHCDECHAECNLTVRTASEQYYCVECARKMVRLFSPMESTSPPPDVVEAARSLMSYDYNYMEPPVDLVQTVCKWVLSLSQK